MGPGPLVTTISIIFLINVIFDMRIQRLKGRVSRFNFGSIGGLGDDMFLSREFSETEKTDLERICTQQKVTHKSPIEIL